MPCAPAGTYAYEMVPVKDARAKKRKAAKKLLEGGLRLGAWVVGP